MKPAAVGSFFVTGLILSFLAACGRTPSAPSPAVTTQSSPARVAAGGAADMAALPENADSYAGDPAGGN